MKLSPAWSSVTTALLSISYMSPAAFAAGNTSPASTLFKIPTGSTSGSCDDFNLDQVISDASNMAQAAITAINNYQSQSFFSAPAPGVVNTYNAAWAMFGAPGSYASLINRVSIKSEGTAILNNIKKNYQSVIDSLKSTSTLMNGVKPAVLACDDNFLTWVTQLQDLNSNLKSSSAGEQTILSAFAAQGQTFSSKSISNFMSTSLKSDLQQWQTEQSKGSVQGFYFSNWNSANILIQDEGRKKPDGSAGGALCTDGTMDAETWAKYGFMLCCPRMFQLPANVASVVGSLGGTPTGTNINSFKTAAGAFLHEMMHFLDMKTATSAKITDQVINGQKAYGWDQCSLLGTFQPDQALLNADSYHYFAVASSLGAVNFGTEGIAQ